MKTEQDFFKESEDMYGIYQLNDTPEARNLLFRNSRYYRKNNLEILGSNYDLVYADMLKQDMNLDDLYYIFNCRHPEGFTGHSLSVGDVILIKRDGKITCHFVDSMGFKPLPGFTNERFPNGTEGME